MTITTEHSSALQSPQEGPLFQPGRIGRMMLRNRFVQAPIFTQFASTFGEVDERLIEYHRARARGGVGLIILEYTSIDWEVGRTVGHPIRIDSGWRPATPSGSSGSPCSAPAPSGRPASAWTDRAATVRAGGSAAIAKAVVERWFTSEFPAAHPDVRAAHEARWRPSPHSPNPEPSIGDVPALGQHTYRLLIESGMAPAAAEDALSRGIALQAEKFRPAPNP